MLKRGFTLIELLVVIAIIGLLASIITVSLVSSKAKGRDGKRVADIKIVQLALETYYNDNGFYPTAIYSASSYGPAFSPTYLTTVPKDPTDNTTSYKYSAYNATGAANCTSTGGIRYHLAATMESDDGAVGAPGPKNGALQQDNDWAGYGSGSPCTGSTANFNGYSIGGTTGCNTTTVGAYDGCYDVTN